MKSVIICDMEGLITNLNDGAIKMFGYDSKELVGKKRVSIFSPGEIVLQNVLGWLKNANETGEHNTKTNFVRKDGSTFSAKIKLRQILQMERINHKLVIVVLLKKLMRMLILKLI